MMDILLYERIRQEFEAILDKRLDLAFQRHAAPNPPPRNDKPTEAGQAFLSKKQAARLLSCSPSTIDNHARAGRLTRHYVGGKSVRFDRQQVLSLAQKHTNHKQKGDGK